MLLIFNLSFKSNINEIIYYIIIYELILCYDIIYILILYFIPKLTFNLHQQLKPIPILTLLLLP